MNYRGLELWELVRLVSERYGKRLSAHKRKNPKASRLESLTVQQFQYLQVIERHSPLSVGEIARYFKVTSPTATSIVNRLEQEALVVKKPSSQDGRIQLMQLTPKGKDIIKIQEDAFRSLAVDIEKALTPQELKKYAELTGKVCGSLE
jgi:DNA-binding MarR family transcriptional regulator